MKNVTLKMAMFRPLQNENYNKIYKSDYATFVYVALRNICKKNTSLTTTPKQIYMSLVDEEPNQKIIRNIKDGLDILEKENIIYFNIYRSTYVIETDGLEIDTKNEFYFNIPTEYLYKILMQPKSAIKIFHQYVLMCSTINVKDNMGIHKREFFADMLNVDPKTITRRNKLFEKLDIMSFSEHRNGIDKNGEFCNLPKIYVMPEYKNILVELQEKKIKNSIKNKNKEINKQQKEYKEKLKQQKDNEKSFDYDYEEICPF